MDPIGQQRQKTPAYDTLIVWIEDSGLISQALHPNIPIRSGRDLDVFANEEFVKFM